MGILAQVQWGVVGGDVNQLLGSVLGGITQDDLHEDASEDRDEVVAGRPDLGRNSDEGLLGDVEGAEVGLAHDADRRTSVSYS